MLVVVEVVRDHAEPVCVDLMVCGVSGGFGWWCVWLCVWWWVWLCPGHAVYVSHACAHVCVERVFVAIACIYYI